jgi:hypothetical protein
MNRLRSSILEQEATNSAIHGLLEDDSLDDKLAAIDREEPVERLFRGLKNCQPLLA